MIFWQAIINVGMVSGVLPVVGMTLPLFSYGGSSVLTVMMGVGLASGTGGYFISQAYRSSEAALIAPFEYLALVLAIFWGITIFGEFPDAWAWTGIGLILGSGLFVLWRESVLNKKLASERPMPRNR